MFSGDILLSSLGGFSHCSSVEYFKQFLGLLFIRGFSFGDGSQLTAYQEYSVCVGADLYHATCQNFIWNTNVKGAENPYMVPANYVIKESVLVC
jgi:hypothetical protein